MTRLPLRARSPRRSTLLAAAAAAALATACGAPPGAGDDVGDDGADAGVDPARALDRCAAAGVDLVEAWDVDNLHGPIVAMAAAGDGTVLLATADGAVKQWSLGTSVDQAPLPGGRPSYGTPLTEAGAVVAALAVADGAAAGVLGADAAGALRRWTLPDGGELPSRVVTTEPLTAIAAVGAAAIVADASFGGAMRVIPLDGGAAGAPFETTLWGVTSLRRGVGGLYVGGHDYGMAAIERRDPGAPAAVADLWDPLTVEGWVRGLAAASTGDLAAVGDAWLLVLDGGDLAAGPRARLDQPVRAAAWTASGAYLAVAVDGRVTLWDRDLVAEVAGFDVPDPVALAVDPSGERLIVASGDGHLRALSCR